VGDVAHASSGPGCGDPGFQSALGGRDQGHALGRLRAAHDEADRRVRGDSPEGDGEVEGEQVTVSERVVVRESVQDGVVDGGADVVPEGAAAERGGVVDVAGLRPGVLDHGPHPPVDLEKVGADLAAVLHAVQDVGDESAAEACSRDLRGGQDLDHGVRCHFPASVVPESLASPVVPALTCSVKDTMRPSGPRT